MAFTFANINIVYAIDVSFIKEIMHSAVNYVYIIKDHTITLLYLKFVKFPKQLTHTYAHFRLRPA